MKKVVWFYYVKYDLRDSFILKLLENNFQRKAILIKYKVK